ncbi:M23 family metallopeptidase [Hugenholtzia roseola]|uniref:M23 family metallopeptidase n=1 Tax=Hugenholtzia roseola TaxID=1002 RepID=UPI00047D8F21|nr:M23 family metallopeptidase [Hugenholtzia roseola]
MKTQRTLWELLTRGYLFIVRDEENFEIRRSFRFNYAKIAVLGMVLSLFLLIPAFFVGRSLGTNAITIGSDKAELLKLLQKTDSLETTLTQQEEYHKRLRSIISGKPIEELIEQEQAQENSGSISPEELGKISKQDSLFRKEFEEDESESKNNLKNKQEQVEIRNIVFFPPVTGIITNRYQSQTEHYGVDIVAPKNEPIKATAAGTVILASWTQDAGYVIGVQHANELISFYKHNSVLLKSVGETVKAGEPLAIIGNTGELTDGPHLHFELWYAGNPVNPEDFVSF